jgi:hypothetical protein
LEINQNPHSEASSSKTAAVKKVAQAIDNFVQEKTANNMTVSSPQPQSFSGQLMQIVPYPSLSSVGSNRSVRFFEV